MNLIAVVLSVAVAAAGIGLIIESGGSAALGAALVAGGGYLAFRFGRDYRKERRES